MVQNIRLGVNIDHVATVRNARGGKYPDPTRAALLAERAGADGITAHLREDRRHIGDHDIASLMQELRIPLNFEMAPTQEMQEIALKHLPNAVCLVPEKREEVTTEGGLDIIKDETRLRNFIEPLKNSGCRISIFIGAEKKQVDAAFRVGAQVVELHTGAYCDLFFDDMVVERDIELERLVETARYASEIGLEVHAGHGLTYDTVKTIAEIAELTELNIGHFLVGESIFCGMEKAITQMQTLMNEARSKIVID
tara:strand:+ start:302 stop:1060 length:759 start_codon:yes stop_codon:yes gene_type:complete